MTRRPTRARSPAPSRIATVLSLGRRVLVTLRDLSIGLAVISAVASLPSSVTDGWSSHAQRAVAIARDIRGLASDLAHAAAVDAGGALGTLLDDLTPLLAPQPATQAPTAATAPSVTLPRVAANFSAAKRQLYERVYAGHRVTFYCGCAYDAQGRTALTDCGLKTLTGIARADRVEAEHIFPAAQFGQSLPCWRAPATFAQCLKPGGGQLTGRACCEKVDTTFANAHNDLQNLVPAVGAINGKRSNFNWGMVNAGERFGSCEIRIDASIRRVQPPVGVRGDIARTMLYMSDTYGFRLSRQDQQLYAAWNNLDPPDAWEIERDQRIALIQGRGNRYVEDYRRL